MQVIHIELQMPGEARGITSILRCEIAAWRKPEEEIPRTSLEAYCSLYCQQHGYFSHPRGNATKQLHQYLNQNPPPTQKKKKSICIQT